MRQKIVALRSPFVLKIASKSLNTAPHFHFVVLGKLWTNTPFEEYYNGLHVSRDERS